MNSVKATINVVEFSDLRGNYNKTSSPLMLARFLIYRKATTCFATVLETFVFTGHAIFRFANNASSFLRFGHLCPARSTNIFLFVTNTRVCQKKKFYSR